MHQFNPAQLCKDMNQFQALDSDDLQDIDCLFNGIDPVTAFSPSFSGCGMISFANAPFTVFELQNLSNKIQVNNPTLELSDNRVVREKLQPSQILPLLTTIQSPRGHEIISFSSVQSKLIFDQNPAMFMVYPLALGLSSPDFLPLQILMDLPKMAKLLNSI